MDRTHRKILTKYKHQILPLNHVVGIGYGKKVKGNRRTNEDSIIILVDKKISEDLLDKKDLVPQKLDHLKTDVQEIGKLQLLDVPRSSKYRPAPAGVSIGHYKISAGTLGAVVKDRKTGEPLILSNNHVLANITDGYDGRSKKGDPILQPGSYDEGKQNDDVIAHLERFVPIRASSGVFNSPENLVDCAVARPIKADMVEDNILGIGKVQGIKEPEVGMRVVKSGRTTGITQGSIRAIDSTVSVNLDDKREAVFTDQIVLGPMSEGGDSGSLVMDRDHNAIGLLFAGSNKATVCNRIGNVMDQLKIDFFSVTNGPGQEEDGSKNEEKKEGRKDSEKRKGDTRGEKGQFVTPFSGIFLLLLILILSLNRPNY